MIRKIVLLTVLILSVGTLAQAQPDPNFRYQRAGKWDYSLQTRYISAHDYSGESGSSLSFQDDLGWGFGFNYNFNQKFSLGIEFGWHTINYTALVIPEVTPHQAETYSNSLDTSKFGLTGSWNILEGHFTPYVNGGIAWAMIDTNIFAGWGSGCYWDPYWGYVCGTYPATYGTNATAYNIGLGGRLELGKSFFMRLGYEYGGMSVDVIDSQHMVRFDMGFFN